MKRKYRTIMLLKKMRFVTLYTWDPCREKGPNACIIKFPVGAIEM